MNYTLKMAYLETVEQTYTGNPSHSLCYQPLTSESGQPDTQSQAFLREIYALCADISERAMLKIN